MIILIFMLALVVGAHVFPNSAPGRWLRDLTTGGWRRVVPVAIVLLGLTLLMSAAPELWPLAAGLDVSLIADILMAATVVLVQLNLRRVRSVVRRAAGMVTRTLRAMRRPRTRQRRKVAARRGTSRNDDDAPAFAVA
ncbi:hypothetical protein [Asticcacaulis sp. AC466]|uniref:hypothetical protein n=1 Tax=Asticcacaulis sp. AC466 TaxID=1282362 RepID=UPI00040FE9AD|nr:hypothetical protein [Asticcacaulis sp. AC466]